MPTDLDFVPAKWLVLLPILFITACASVSEQRHDLTARTGLTASLTDMRFVSLPKNGRETLMLDNKQPVYIFSTGRSFYAARTIEGSTSTRVLHFKTYLSTMFLPKANVLVPQFLYLNDSKQPLPVVERFSLSRGTDFWRGQYFEGQVSVPVAARYIVVFASNAEYPQLYSSSENGTERLVPHAPTGTIDVMLSLSEGSP